MKKNSYHHGNLKNALIEAGIQVLADEGLKGLSLRKVARIANVSHAAPYAHFTDKQALIAAISTEGFRLLYERIQQTIEHFTGDPLRQLVETSWAYVSFAISNPSHFKIIFSGIVEEEWKYPSLIELSQASFQQLNTIVESCKAQGILQSESAEVSALAIWSQMHGLASLILERKLPNEQLEQIPKKALVVAFLQHMIKVEIPHENSVD
jgi:AcrR family transcriptional regulator